MIHIFFISILKLLLNHQSSVNQSRQNTSQSNRNCINPQKIVFAHRSSHLSQSSTLYSNNQYCIDRMTESSLAYPDAGSAQEPLPRKLHQLQSENNALRE